VKHMCHAVECKREVPPLLLMCPRHWRLVPKEIQHRVYTHYRRGQCDGKVRPSAAWHLAAAEAIAAVALHEGKLTEEQARGRIELARRIA
jgi:hypothetical protein